MQTFTLYRRDFKNNADDGESLFNGVLLEMGYTGDIEDIETVEIHADGNIHAYTYEGDAFLKAQG